MGGLKPDAAVLVATVKALKMHGGVAKDKLGAENTDALRAGCKNLGRHMKNFSAPRSAPKPASVTT